MPLPPAGAGAGEDQLADQLGLVLGDHLGDHAAHGESVKIDLVETQRADEPDGVLGHRLDGVWRFAGGGTDAAVVEGDHPVLCGDAVDHPRVPVVEVPCQVHEEDDRDTGLRAELAVGEIHTTSGYGAGWCVLVRTVYSHCLLLPGRLAGNPPVVREGCGADARALGSGSVPGCRSTNGR
jgi:hypothetical protein